MSPIFKPKLADSDSLMFANSRINQFEHGHASTHAFKNLQRQTFIKGLRIRVNQPETIDQGKASLCGPAALFYTVLVNRPDMYVEFAIDLFEKGEGTIGDLVIKPHQDTLEARQDVGRIHPVDWVVLASLRDSENLFFNYGQTSDQVGGITMPNEIASWLTKIGFKKVTNDTSLFLPSSLDNLLKAHQLRLGGYSVNLLIHHYILYWRYENHYPVSATHWVTLTTDVEIDGNMITHSIVQNLRDELDEYYDGFDPDEVDGESDVPFNHTIDFHVQTYGQGSHGIGEYANLIDFMRFYFGFVAAG